MCYYWKCLILEDIQVYRIRMYFIFYTVYPSWKIHCHYYLNPSPSSFDPNPLSVPLRGAPTMPLSDDLTMSIVKAPQPMMSFSPDSFWLNCCRGRCNEPHAFHCLRTAVSKHISSLIIQKNIIGLQFWANLTLMNLFFFLAFVFFKLILTVLAVEIKELMI